MGIIRSNQLPTAARAFSMNDVEDVAKRVLLKAKLQAENLLAAAMEEAEQLKAAAREEGAKEGFDHGHAEGVKHGLEAGKQEAAKQHAAELKAVIKAYAAATAEIEARRKELDGQALVGAVKLAVGIARRVTKREGLIDPEVLQANLAEAIKLSLNAGDLRVAVHPDQLAGLKAALPQLKMKLPALKHVELLADPGVAAGGCRVYTRNGEVDADLDAQLDRVIADLLPLPPPAAPAAGAGEGAAA
ncbi:MAG TPA: FliH/SctL family protein [Humisphaera sp.]